MSAPVTAVGPSASTGPAGDRPAAAPKGFQAALAAALQQAPGTTPADRTTAAPPAVPLGRMLAAMGSSAVLPPASPWSVNAGTAVGVPTAGASSARAEGGAGIVEAASRYLGVPYRWGGADPATGLDCSGLVQRALADLGVSVPRTSVQQSGVGAPVASLAEARPGDLLFWASSRPGQANHIGIYVGEGQMLHAPQTGDVVRIAPVRKTPPTTIRRVATG